MAADVGNDRTAQQVLQRCTRRGLVVDIRKGAWDSEEDAQLLQARPSPGTRRRRHVVDQVAAALCSTKLRHVAKQALSEYGEKWSKVAQHVPTRTDVQCRERFKNVLDPKLTSAPWTAGLTWLCARPNAVVLARSHVRRGITSLNTASCDAALQRRTGASGRSWRSVRAAAAAVCHGRRWQPSLAIAQTTAAREDTSSSRRVFRKALHSARQGLLVHCLSSSKQQAMSRITSFHLFAQSEAWSEAEGAIRPLCVSEGQGSASTARTQQSLREVCADASCQVAREQKVRRSHGPQCCGA